MAPRLTFDRGLVGPLDGRERRLIRYNVVRLLDVPDELRGIEIGFLDQGDEVQLLERQGTYWLVLCPNGGQGWIHKMTLGEVVADDDGPAAERRHRHDADRGRHLDDGRRRRRRRPDRLPPVARTPGLTRPTVSLPEHQDVLVDDVRDERARIAVRPQAAARLVPDEIALRDEPDSRRARGQVRAREHVPAVLVRVAHDDQRVAPDRAGRGMTRRGRTPSGRGTSRSPGALARSASRSLTIA